MYSQNLLNNRISRNPAVLDRINIAMQRVQNILETETVACLRTLEQKIAAAGPKNQRVDPHIIGLALYELIEFRKFVKIHKHKTSGSTKCYANSRTSQEIIIKKLDNLAPLYQIVSKGNIPNQVGDALELITQLSLEDFILSNRRYSFFGGLKYRNEKNKEGRYAKNKIPETVSGFQNPSIPDFYLTGYDAGPLCVECKNLREWLYPTSKIFRELIKKAIDSNTTPIIIARRIHYSTITNLLVPAGIIAHESYYQYYPSGLEDLADNVKQKRLLGYSDVKCNESLDNRSQKFFSRDLPNIVDSAAAKFNSNRDALEKYAIGKIPLAELYTEIGSPAGGKWVNFEEEDDIPF